MMAQAILGAVLQSALRQDNTQGGGGAIPSTPPQQVGANFNPQGGFQSLLGGLGSGLGVSGVTGQGTLGTIGQLLGQQLGATNPGLSTGVQLLSNPPPIQGQQGK